MEFNGTFFVSIISFLVFVFLMNRILYRPMSKIATQRREFVSGNLQAADDNRKKADEISAQKEEKLVNARNDARKKYNESIEEFKSGKNDIIQKAQNDSGEDLARAYESLNAASDEAKEKLKSRMAELANDISEKILGYRSEVREFDNDTVNKILYHG